MEGKKWKLQVFFSCSNLNEIYKVNKWKINDKLIYFLQCKAFLIQRGGWGKEISVFIVLGDKSDFVTICNWSYYLRFSRSKPCNWQENFFQPSTHLRVYHGQWWIWKGNEFSFVGKRVPPPPSSLKLVMAYVRFF